MHFKHIFEKVKIWSDFTPPLKLKYFNFLVFIFFEGFPKWRFIFSVCLGTPTNLIQQHYLVWLHSTEYNWFCSYFRLMVMLAWLMTLIFSWPQAVIFRVMKHPNKEFYQCTTFNFFENLALGIGNDSFYRKLKQVIEELSYKIYADCRWTNPYSMGWCLPHRLQLCSVFWASNCHSNKLHSVYYLFFPS